MKVKFGTWGVSLLAAAVVAVPAMGAVAAPVPVPGRTGSLTQVGPIGDNGFPTWYRDSNNVRLELCLTLTDPLCPALPGALIPPLNLPQEVFYQMASATIVKPGTDLMVEMNLEGNYFGNPANNVTFSRIRIRDRKTGLTPGDTYRVTHPYGIDDVVVDAGGQINDVEDFGIAMGNFGAVLGGRFGPFLKWDPLVAPTAPVGYVGDPGVLHKVVGSPYGTNSVKLEKKVGATYTPIGFTDQFLVQGRYATNSGVDVARATYTQPAAPGAASMDVFATSEVGQVIQVPANAALGFATTTLSGEQGRYFGRLPLTVPAGGFPVGATIDVTNAGDKPVATKAVKVTDAVTIASAIYTVGTATVPGSLAVTAASGDAVNPSVLTVTGFGPLVAGTATFTPVSAPPSMITVTSSLGGSATIATSVAGAALAPTIPVAAFLAPVSVSLGQSVLLDSAPSTGGPITGYAWGQDLAAGTGTAITATSPTTLTTPTLAFTPTAQGTYVMNLVVTSAGGASLPVTRTITVTPAAAAVVASAGPDQTALRGSVVTLDASATVGAQSLAWTQTGGTPMTLSSATATNPTFTYSLMALPKAAVGSPNTGYVANNGPLTFTLTATAVGGATTAIDTVVISPLAESFTNVIARYRTLGGEWRITGNTNFIGGVQRLAVVLGPNVTGRTIGTVTTVQPGGLFSLRAGALPDPRVPAPDATQVTLISATGGVLTVPGLLITP